jgi:hypothetical protein
MAVTEIIVKRALMAACLICLWAPRLDAHSGPPFPIVSNQTSGPYVVSIWTDPDSTDDGSAAGRFWIVLAPIGSSATLPGDTRAEVTATPIDRAGESHAQKTEPVKGEVTRQFAALVLDHEGRFSVRVTVDGPLGRGTLDSEVEATYDLRPSRVMLIVYLMPFVLAGLLWAKLLLRRRQHRHSRSSFGS